MRFDVQYNVVRLGQSTRVGLSHNGFSAIWWTKLAGTLVKRDFDPLSDPLRPS